MSRYYKPRPVEPLPEQHCGKMTEHPRHGHYARPRPVVLSCVCEERTCVCPNVAAANRKREFTCSGKLVVEGAPAHLPTEVGV